MTIKAQGMWVKTLWGDSKLLTSSVAFDSSHHSTVLFCWLVKKISSIILIAISEAGCKIDF